MQIKTVHYSALINLGSYSNEKIGFTAQISEGETVEQVIEQLREKVKQNGGVNAQELYDNMWKAKSELERLERKIINATEQWNATAEFLRSQGIKPEVPNMPQFTKLLPEVQEENSGVVDGELEDDSETSGDGF